MSSRLHTARAYWLSLRWEWPRIRAWRNRHYPLTQMRYSWWDAWRATVENTPQFDTFWDDEMEDGG